MPKITVDPFEIKAWGKKDSPADFADLLDEIAALKETFEELDDPNSRWYQHDAISWVALHHYTRKAKYCVGTVFRLRMKDLSHRGGASGISDLGFPDDDGLGDHLAFLWDIERETLWFQRERKTLTHNIFVDYVRDRTSKTVLATPIFRADPVKRAEEFNHYRRFEFAYKDAGQKAPANSYLAKYLKKLSDDYGGVRVEVRLSPGRGDFLADNTRDLVHDAAELVKKDEDSVDRARVTGRMSPDEKDLLIDLLGDRQDFSQGIKAKKSRDPTALMNVVKLVWKENRDNV